MGSWREGGARRGSTQHGTSPLHPTTSKVASTSRRSTLARLPSPGPVPTIPDAEGAETDWLKGIVTTFREASKDGTRMHREEFRHACTRLYYARLSPAELDVAFDRIDIRSNGHIDLNAFSTFILARFEEEQGLQEGGPGKGAANARLNHYTEPSRVDELVARTPLSTPHQESIIRLTYLEHSNKYVTCSREGTLCTWTQEWKGHKTYPHIGHPPGEDGSLETSTTPTQPAGGQRVSSVPTAGRGGAGARLADRLAGRRRARWRWVHDCVYLPQLKRLAIASDDRIITLIDSTTMRKQMALYLKEDVALSLDACYDADTNSTELFYGTDSGQVGVITLHHGALASLTAFQHQIPHISVENGNGQLAKGLGTFYKYQAHGDWALQTKYYPFLHAFFSCSRDEEASIVQHARRDSIWLQLGVGVPKGVNSFAVCKTPAVLVAGGTDRMVRMFNPYRLGRPMATLPGHKAPISQVTVSDGVQQAFTLSLDMNVRIWNLFKQNCIQSITEPGSGSPEQCITALYVAPNGTLVTASTFLTIYPSASACAGRAARQNSAEHRQPIVSALYNPLYGQVLSGCREGVINVWDVESGARVKSFHDIHGAAELTALALDSNYKRILTGALDGSVYVWNFSSGQVIQDLRSEHKSEVSQILCVDTNSKHILTSGCDKKVTVFVDDKESTVTTPRFTITDHTLYGVLGPRVATLHLEDVSALAYHAGSGLLATGSWDGELVVSVFHSGTILSRWCPGYASFRTESQGITKLLALALDPTLPLFVGATDHGFLRFWDAERNHLLLEQKLTPSPITPEGEGAGLHSLAWDEAHALLFAGDSTGRITAHRVAVQRRGEAVSVTGGRTRPHYRKRPSLPHVAAAEQQQKQEKEEEHAFAVTLTPVLAFSASTQAITSLNVCVRGGATYLVCGTLTGKLNLFTDKGELVGYFGQESAWTLGSTDTYCHTGKPEDVAAAEEEAAADARAEAQHQQEERARLAATAAKGNDPVTNRGAYMTIPSIGSSGAPDRSVPEERQSWFLASLYAQGHRELLARKREGRVVEMQADRLIPLDLEEVSKKLNDPALHAITKERSSLRHMTKQL